MSDLHKQFLKRVKQQEQAFGLASLSEDGGGDNDTVFFPPAKQQIETKPKFDRTEINHEGIFKNYEMERNSTFPIIESYKDQKSGIVFQVYFKPPSSSKVPIFVGCHGAGSSSMTYCKLAQSFNKTYEEESCGIFLFDMRGHGGSTSIEPLDFSLTTLTEDFAFVLEKFYQKHNIESVLYLMGHSLGGSVLTNYLHHYPDNQFNIKGLIMLDIVEETAVTSLGAMPAFLERIPKRFATYKQAIDWHVKATNLLKNTESASISVPDLFVDDGEVLKWKIDLKITKPFWDSWFKGLSANFVSCGSKQHVAKLLILAGHETLDTSLIIGQMQGRYSR
ncbi:alpha/beta-hydrolase [Yamadazyma tenuis ATCC 10573]|uniref:Protein phosphatase methylesterase 1 n=1 Tax=Candida tenuis (strain ATCC 10573 / BCRC 21748 / CBS 615 / JCM 9827 / NBRC 10315 / NRRL Y-1498 / VKM Y-70) TaxID=590646 RepID=G3AYF1_CANTC|nr:alpha/beta-hydrolase [Yamadazyma tenuis ATCC 10573]EGV65835.1 alpha/beta-hydrolase [Yamadazyma tenuis ATCC 10573]